jgi:hypothetical protein
MIAGYLLVRQGGLGLKKFFSRPGTAISITKQLHCRISRFGWDLVAGRPPGREGAVFKSQGEANDAVVL